MKAIKSKQLAKIKRTYCKGEYRPEICGDRLADSFLDRCPKCNKTL